MRMRARLDKIAKWVTISVIALVVVAAFAAPVAVIRATHNETDRILARIDQRRTEALDTAIRVNVLTIGCLLLVEPEDRTNEDLERCIREGFEEIG